MPAESAHSPVTKQSKDQPECCLPSAMPLLQLLLLALPALSQAQGPVYRNIGQGVYTFAGDGL